MDTIRTGIIGVGNMGSAHARTIAGGGYAPCGSL